MIKFENFHKISAAVVIVENTQGEILILKRSSKSRQKGWCLPGGKRDEGESSITNAKRELQEETGLDFDESRLTFVGNRFSVKGFGVAVYYIKLNKFVEVELSDEHYDYVWTKNFEGYKLAGNTIDFINCINQNIKESINEDKDYLKNFLIKYETKEECIEIIRTLKILGFEIYDYPDGCNDVDNSMDFFNWIGFVWSRQGYFVQTKEYSKPSLSFQEFMDINNIKSKKITKPDIDPFGEEDWGYSSN